MPSQSPQPSGNLCPVPSHPTSRRHSEGVRKYLRYRLALQVEIRASVTHCSRNVSVTEQLAYRRELDTGLQHVYGRRVA